MKTRKLEIGKEYEVQNRYAVLESIEGSEAVLRDRFDNQFKVNIEDLAQKKSIKNK